MWFRIFFPNIIFFDADSVISVRLPFGDSIFFSLRCRDDPAVMGFTRVLDRVFGHILQLVSD